jgi:hypothetical protein
MPSIMLTIMPAIIGPIISCIMAMESAYSGSCAAAGRGVMAWASTVSATRMASGVRHLRNGRNMISLQREGACGRDHGAMA